MLSKTRLQDIDRRWRAFVFDSRFMRILFGAGIVIFAAGFVFRSLSDFFMRRAFTAWFGCILLFVASSYALTTASSFRRRDFGTALWMAAWTALLCFAAYSSLSFAIAQ